MKKFLATIMAVLSIMSTAATANAVEYKQVVVEPEFGNYAMISMYKGEIPVYEKVVPSVLRTRKTAGGKVVGYINYKDCYIQRKPRLESDTYYEVVIYQTKKSITAKGKVEYSADTIWGYIDRHRITTNGAEYHNWVSQQKYYTDYRGGKDLDSTTRASYWTIHPTSHARFMVFRIERKTAIFDSYGERIGALEKGATVGLKESATGEKGYDKISAYTYKDPKTGKWVEHNGGYWLQLDFTMGSNTEFRSIQ
ncbi:MAG: hypothetical protein LBQ68_07985 [Clostridiales bacterium]|nr:hypothetical protein [Clostridiales bacterium]